MIAILKRRSEFLRIRGGSRWGSRCFVLEGKPRSEVGDLLGARFGFTVTKQIGKAVIRNRIRRRLREAVRKLHPSCTLPHYDYVLIARAPALTCDFAELTQDLSVAFNRVNRPPKVKMRPEAP